MPAQPPPSTPGRTRVLQGSFQGGRPRLAVQPHSAPGARPVGTPPGARPGAPRTAPVAQPFRDSTVFQVPSTVNFAAGGSGQPLPPAVLQKMESFFGASFADVRVHVGPQAASIGALAFTMGSDLYFAPGQYSPHSAQGQRLLGHELTHVVQQRAGRVRNPLGSGVAVVQDPALEAEAERMGMRVGTMQAQPAVQARMPGGQPAGGRLASRAGGVGGGSVQARVAPGRRAPVQAGPVVVQARLVFGEGLPGTGLNDLRNPTEAEVNQVLGTQFEARLVEAFRRRAQAYRRSPVLHTFATFRAFRGQLLAEFIAERRRQAPARYLSQFLSGPELDCAAMLFYLLRRFNLTQQGQYRMQKLEALIQEVLTKRGIIDVKSVEKEVKKVFTPADFAGLLNDPGGLNDFMRGRVAELTGLFGELRTLATLRRHIVKPGTRLTMGAHIPVSGESHAPEVDLRFVSVEGKEVLVENAATIQKLREKLSSSEGALGQRRRYERLLAARPDRVVLAYSASAFQWFDLFRGKGDESVALRVANHNRALLVDGILLHPFELVKALTRLDTIRKKTKLDDQALGAKIREKNLSADFFFNAPEDRVRKTLAPRRRQFQARVREAPVSRRRAPTEEGALSYEDLVGPRRLGGNPFALLAEL